MLTLNNARVLAEAYRLAIPDQIVRQAGGDLLGRGAGGSVEYQDHRSYYLGDDIRHIDWRAYARSDRLTLKMYRREITPVVDVVLDASLSTGSDPAKQQLAEAIAGAFYFMAGQAHSAVRLYASGGQMRRLHSAEQLDGVSLERERDILEAFANAPESWRRGVRVVVSDFLFPHSPADLAAMLGRNADRLIFAQVLSKFEAAPEQSGGVKLVDAETGEGLDLVVDADTIRRYRERLDNLRGELARQVRRTGGAFASVDPSMSPGDIFTEFARQGLIELAA
jgi:uncharacterized protein (DUF58 family)